MFQVLQLFPLASLNVFLLCIKCLVGIRDCQAERNKHLLTIHKRRCCVLAKSFKLPASSEEGKEERTFELSWQRCTEIQDAKLKTPLKKRKLLNKIRFKHHHYHL